MAATTTGLDTKVCYAERLMKYSTRVGCTTDGTSIGGVSTGLVAVIGGFVGSTCSTNTNDVFRYPINDMNNSLLIVGIWDGLASTTNYPAVALRRSQQYGMFGSTDAPASVGVGVFSSALGGGWTLIKCTECFDATSTENQMFTLTVKDTKKYAFYTSTAGDVHDAYQNYIEFMAGYSTCSTGSFAAFSTNGSGAVPNRVLISMFEVP